MNMPTLERRYFIDLLKQQNQHQREKLNEMKQNGSGKGNRSKTISGETLKAKMKGGEIPTN